CPCPSNRPGRRPMPPSWHREPSPLWLRGRLRFARVALSFQAPWDPPLVDLDHRRGQPPLELTAVLPMLTSASRWEAGSLDKTTMSTRRLRVTDRGSLGGNSGRWSEKPAADSRLAEICPSEIRNRTTAEARAEDSSHPLGYGAVETFCWLVCPST